VGFVRNSVRFGGIGITVSLVASSVDVYCRSANLFMKICRVRFGGLGIIGV
jgi:hypothetical protein